MERLVYRLALAPISLVAIASTAIISGNTIYTWAFVGVMACIDAVIICKWAMNVGRLVDRLGVSSSYIEALEHQVVAFYEQELKYNALLDKDMISEYTAFVEKYHARHQEDISEA